MSDGLSTISIDQDTTFSWKHKEQHTTEHPTSEIQPDQLTVVENSEYADSNLQI